MTPASNQVSKKKGGLTSIRFGLVVMFLLILLEAPDRTRVKCEHGDLGSISFHLRRKTKSHRHGHKHLRAQNKTHFAIGIGRSKDGFSLRVRCLFFLNF